MAVAELSVTAGCIFSCYLGVSLLLYFFPTCLHKKKRCLISGKAIAHRGGCAEYLENTMSAFKNAINVGADVLEIDLQITKDRKIVVCHDNDLERLTGKSALISETEFENLPEIMVPLKNHLLPNHTVTHADRRIPLLAEVFQEFPNVPINIDVKEGDDNLRIQVENMIRQYGRESCTIWGNRSETTNSQLYKLNPNIPLIMSLRKVVIHGFIFWLGLLPFVPIKESFYEVPYFKAMLATIPVNRKWRILACMADRLVSNKMLLYHYKRRGLTNWCWIVNDEAHFKACFDRFDGVMTDKISALVAYVKENEQQKLKDN